MAISKAQSRLPEGFKPEDLGQVGTLLPSENSNLEDPDCYLISYLSSPICIGYRNTYIVFITSTELADQVVGFQLVVEKRMPTGEFTNIPEYKQDNASGLFDVKFKDTGYFRLSVIIFGTGLNTSLRILEIEQVIVNQNAEIKSQIEQKDGNLPISLAGNPETLFHVYQNLMPYVQAAFNSFISAYKPPSRLLSSIVYFQYQTPVSLELLDLAEQGLNNTGDTNKVSWCPLWAPLGICGLSIPLFANQATLNLIHALPKMDWVAADILLFIEAFNLSDLNNQKEFDDFKSKLKSDFESFVSNNQVDLFNLIRFPKSNIQFCYVFLNLLQQRLYPNLETETLFEDPKCFCEITSKFYLYNNVFNGSCFDSLYRSAQKKTEIIEKSLGTPFMQFLDNPKVAEARVVDFIPKQLESAFHFAPPLTGDKVLDPVHGAEYANDDISKGEHYSINLENLFKDLNYEKMIDGEMILLDVGYWGNYDRSKPQRDFGMIEGKHVWLCSLSGEFLNNDNGNAVYQKTLSYIPKETPNARKLIEHLKENWGYVVEIVSHTQVITDKLPPNITLEETCLNVIFPDMHLPEEWPEIPAQDKLNRDEKTRGFLRHILLKSQCQNSDNDLRQFRRETQLWIQKLLIDPTNGQEWRTIDFDGTLLQHFVFNNSTWTVTGAEGLYKFSLDNLLAEKDILDRRLSVNSSWFYSPPKKQVDLDEIYGRYYWHLYYYYDIMHSFSSLHTIDQDMLNCEPGPAIDLAVILDSIHKITSTGSIIRVIQVGDLYELWMNREWLYLNFPNADDPNNGNPFMLDLLEKILAPRADGFQIRLDSGWYECDSLVLNIATVEDLTKSIADQKERPYIFHQWPIEHLLKRKKTGNNSKGIYENEIKKESLNRCQVQLKERITSVKEFHLPISPTWDENTPRGKALKKLLSDNILKCSNAAPTEYLWNKMILDLFEQVNCIMVYGNHDGYRGDLMLNEKLSKSEQAQDFYCESGIWVEHGHRWDLECRDGVPSGAAVTNLGYFYFRPHILWADNHKNYLFIDRFRTNTIPGCFRWFVAINDKFASIPIEWQQKGVKPFAITVVGHSHTPDLVKIRIKKEV